ncbi:MAG: RNA polymerase-associated protein RapA [Enterovibrio sp.]
MPYSLGQRWISDAEHELGLGTVVAIDARTVTLMFAACEENRLYSRSDAPITRVIFNQGDTIQSQDGWFLTIEQVQEKQGVITYIGKNNETGEENVALREIFLNHQICFNKPQDKLFAGQIDRMNRFALRYRALTNQYKQHKNPLRGLCGMRAGLIPHQLFIAKEVGRRHAPRVLLADEVGLGKTIEAGMIIHQQILAGRAQRILVVVPETLQHQWLVEMLRRFNLHFTIFDEERCAEAAFDSDNPFDTAQWVLCSLNFLKKSRTRAEQAAESDWDLLVVDEAHHLTWSEKKVSREYQVIESIAQNTPGVLLITATPEQLGHQSHFARLHLLDPDRFYDYQLFIEEEQNYAPIAQAVSELLENGSIISDEARAKLTELLPDAANALSIIDANQSSTEQKTHAKEQLIEQLMDRHGTGRVLFRNTRASVQGFAKRRLQLHPLPLPNQYQTAMRVAGIMANNSASPEQKAQQWLYPEEIFQKFEGDNSTWWAFDPRVNWLLDLLKNNRHQKVLVICAHAHTALSLEQALREREGIRGTVFHEDMSILERDQAAAYFAQEETGAQVLICSEIGSEGRNFQFASQLVMFDLPMSPDLLEQRIGRLDRIGQKNDIDIHVPFMQETSQAILARWYHEGLNAFEQTCPAGRTIFEQVQPQLLALLSHCKTDVTIEDLIEESAQQLQELKSQLEAGRDRLLEMHSNGGEAAKLLAEQIAQQDASHELVSFAIELFDTVGIEQDDRGENAIFITPSDQMLVPHFPNLPLEGCSITFDRDTALAREDLSFLSWEHPIIQGGIDLLLTEKIGITAVSLLKNKALPVGTFFVELIFTADPQAPKSCGVQRFFPTTPVRLLLDAKGTELSAQIDFETLNRKLSPTNRHIASKLVSSTQSQIHPLIEHGKTLAESQLAQLKTAASEELQTLLGKELARLETLQKVNLAIRDDEISALREQLEIANTAITQTKIELDSIRLIVVSHQ